jgi:cobalamin biosynthesis Mg chelatase CobN
MNTYMGKELYVKTLLHELTHMKQWVDGMLRSRYGKLCYSKEPVEKYEYWYQPHEVEARYMEEELYYEYLVDKGLVTVDEVVHSFPNRLMQVL